MLFPIVNPYIRSHFNIATWTGTGAEQAITGVGFSADMVIGRHLDGVLSGLNTPMQDSVQGTSKQLLTNTNTARTSVTQSIKSFDSDGVTLGTSSEWNSAAGGGKSFVGFFFRKHPSVFDIQTYLGTGVAKTETHDLDAAPEMMIVRDVVNPTGVGYAVYHKDMDASTPEDYYLRLDTTNTSKINDATVWNDTAPTSSVFTVGTSSITNGNTNTHIAYLWKSMPGVCSVGSYTGDGNASQAITGLGFSPRFLLVNCTDSGTVEDQWRVWNSVRGDNKSVILEDTDDEETSGFDLSLDADGFTVGYAAGNVSTKNYIYLAMA